ncbi:hypothetical protein BKK79_29230 [Cupriavidus sp. USMAA2-4]|uniref:Sigma-70 family RNA polymerase sigma factor n=1 Tax=Cupriavidus malaysiensis TaxID=367825 RepID=A0ABN4TTD4_9BURK|nr:MULTISPECIES: RNA polymerase sigma factor [Cupriavidus]AOY95779.1 hypothetical protein BKK79_29230 [Cupriavidus sp. USMAA2-4]AOZ03707.1 hypothetical protein BKK81_32370 [Cupriavidus sp. USMAHM13]AOZ08930.1 hypothetical protein BKK80_23950 [Cupriavidus malaysiensis]
MTEETRPVLADYLARHYGSLKRRVTRLLGSSDLAGDALHDAWVRLSADPAEASPVRSPGSYVVRMAVNIAVDALRRGSRSLPLDEVEALIELADPLPGPAQTTEGRSELAAMARLLERMPPRRREVFLLVHLECLTQEEVARRLGCSKRTVEYELKYAHDYLVARMER